MTDDNPSATALDATPEAKRQLEEIHSLEARYADAYSTREYMMDKERESLFIRYMLAVGTLRHEVFTLEVEVKSWRMKVDLAQAALNRMKKPDLDAIEDEVAQKLAEFRAKLVQDAEMLKASKDACNVDVRERKECKELYRLLVKRLHPDLNPDQPDFHRDLLLQAQTAYRNDDLERLRSMVLKLDVAPAESQRLQASSELRARRIETLRHMIHEVEEDIRKINGAFPFDHREKLLDQGWVDGENRRQEERRTALQAEIRMLEVHFALLSAAASGPAC